MKTSINISEYEFSGKNNPLFQISDDPKNKLARVIELERATYAMDSDAILLHAKTHYINPSLKMVVFSSQTLLDGKEWNIVKGEQTAKVDPATFLPIPNKAFDKAKPVDLSNYPYELTDGYTQFKEISISLLNPLLSMFINSNDNNKLFDV